MAEPNPNTSLRTSDDQRPTVRRRALVWAVASAFGVYFCMYAFRKPFAVAQYTDVTTWGWEFKTVAVSTQVFGYMLSKFIGIKVLSEMPANRRAIAIVGLILFAQLALLGFALVPAPYNLICLFLNGLPLGMIFGLVLSYLEGRTQTEALAAGLCTSFILADGFTKSVGKSLLDVGVSQFWMPAAVGAIFLLPLLGFVWMLKQVGIPSSSDIAARSERLPLTAPQRREFFVKYAPGLIPILLMFFLVTVVRSVRSDFAPEIWTSLGVATKPSIFSYSEMWVGLGVTLANGAAVLVSDNYRAFRIALATCVCGFLVMLMATAGEHSSQVAPFWFMVLIGIGLYLPYVAVHTTVFERLIAMTRARGNLVFLMYLADSLAYLGYVGVMLTRNALSTEDDFMQFFRPLCYVTGLASLACMLISHFAFAGVARQLRTHEP